MYSALIATCFTGTGVPGVDPFRPAVADTYTLSWEDVVATLTAAGADALIALFKDATWE